LDFIGSSLDYSAASARSSSHTFEFPPLDRPFGKQTGSPITKERLQVSNISEEMFKFRLNRGEGTTIDEAGTAIA